MFSVQQLRANSLVFAAPCLEHTTALPRNYRIHCVGSKDGSGGFLEKLTENGLSLLPVSTRATRLGENFLYHKHRRKLKSLSQSFDLGHLGSKRRIFVWRTALAESFEENQLPRLAQPNQPLERCQLAPSRVQPRSENTTTSDLLLPTCRRLLYTDAALQRPRWTPLSV